VVLGGFGFCGAAFLLSEKIFDGFRETPVHLEPEKIIVDSEKIEEVA
jgi:hypothetical protein